MHVWYVPHKVRNGLQILPLHLKMRLHKRWDKVTSWNIWMATFSLLPDLLGNKSKVMDDSFMINNHYLTLMSYINPCHYIVNLDHTRLIKLTWDNITMHQKPSLTFTQLVKAAYIIKQIFQLKSWQHHMCTQILIIK